MLFFSPTTVVIWNMTNFFVLEVKLVSEKLKLDCALFRRLKRK